MTNATKHTPGPWTCNIDAEGLNVFQDDPEHPGNGDHIMCIPRHPESEANARLIAAAPEMLAALTKTVSALVAAIPQTPAEDQWIAEALQTARAAIAKATGGAS